MMKITKASMREQKGSEVARSLCGNALGEIREEIAKGMKDEVPM